MSKELPTYYQEFIAKTRYARWLEEEGRRETWKETVDRYVGNIISPHVDSDTAEQIREAIFKLNVMPSMRLLMTAGEAFARDNTCGYNCSYLPVDDVKSFDEAMFILLCGTGVGFSVERQYINKLPEVPQRLFNSDTTIVVSDSKEGWAKALRQLLALLWSGEVPKWDLSKVRPSGSKLKVFGGRASGPDPLEQLFNFCISIFNAAVGRKLTSIECHDIMCKIAEVVVVGGVRRSAMISLSNLTDDRMRRAKTGVWWESNPQRALANNSVCYTEKPDMEAFMQEWFSLVESKSGERGIFNRVASAKKVEEGGRRGAGHEWGTNPCSEIILRPHQFCNLSEVVVREDDTFESLSEKVRLATVIGTIQSSFTHFPYLRSEWQRSTKEERLLGVSLTGIMDNDVMSGQVPSGFDSENYETLADVLNGLKQIAIQTNAEWSKSLGIEPSAAITCVKPSGTVSQLVNSSSGIHARYSNHYIRTVRGDIKDPVTQFLIDKGVPNAPDVTAPDKTVVFSFPVATEGVSVCREDMSAIEQLEMWLIYQRHWCEHKPSITINVEDDEWLGVGAFVYKNFDEMSGVSFLPRAHIYKQAPYQDVSEEEYQELVDAMPTSLDWSSLIDYEREDNTVSSQVLACSGASCEVVDI